MLLVEDEDIAVDDDDGSDEDIGGLDVDIVDDEDSSDEDFEVLDEVSLLRKLAIRFMWHKLIELLSKVQVFLWGLEQYFIK